MRVGNLVVIIKNVQIGILSDPEILLLLKGKKLNKFRRLHK